MRLIDADKIIENEDTYFNGDKTVKEILDGYDIDYDVDKVVEQLEELYKREVDFATMVRRDNNFDQTNGYLKGIMKALEIVKAGGNSD